MADHLKTISAERLTQAVNEAVNAHHEVHKSKHSFLPGKLQVCCKCCGYSSFLKYMSFL